MGPSAQDQPSEGEQPVDEMSYTEASAELDAIVGFFEGRDVDVDQLVGRLVRATAIIEELDKRLRRTRVQVEQLVPRLTAVLEEVSDDEPSPAPTDDGGRRGAEPRPDSGSTPATSDADVPAARHGPPPDAADVDDADDESPGLF
jgi:exonuclease VII small subunit